MTKTYIVTERSFIDGALREPGYETTSALEAPGPNLRLKDSGQKLAASTAPDAPLASTVAAFEAKHIAGGRYAVVQISDGSRASKLYSKDEGDPKALAEAEAERLNAGGQLDLGSLPEPSPEPEGGGNLPDA